MKINNKGFMLAEVIVTSTVVVVALIAFYASFNRIYSNYKVRNSYYNIDGVYATKMMFNELFDVDGGVNGFVNNTYEAGHYTFLIQDGICGESLDGTSCSIVRELYDIENMILVEYDEEIINNQLRSNIENQTFNDYIDYLIEYYGIETDNEYSYLILTEIKDGENYYYSNLRIR